MDYLPLFLSLKHRLCLVIGGGEIALRKIRLLHSAGACVRVVAPHIVSNITNLLKQEQHELIYRSYQESDLEGVSLVIAATDDDQLNKQAANDALAKNIFANVVDNAGAGSALMPAIVDRSPVMVAFSTGGKAPVLSRLLREKLEGVLPHGYGRLAEMASEFRERVKKRFPRINERRYYWEKIFSGPAAEYAFSGNFNAAEKLMERTLEESETTVTGEVYLVGGGPGDPDLLTFKALRLMQQADVVVYDRLISKDVLELCRRDAEYIYVGKKKNEHTCSQEEINRLLISQAQLGRRVLRLKGGDPFIFGRGGEEIENLSKEGISFQVVPGITAASGCASYAGIPLTHRDYAQSVRFVTGHLKKGGFNLNWREMLDPDQTLVFYMGLAGLAGICDGLISHGRCRDTPVALIQQGTMQQQSVVIGTLSTVAEKVKQVTIKSPTLIIIGRVVNLHDQLKWFQGSI